MIRQWKARWWAAQEASLKAQFAPQMIQLEAALHSSAADVADQLRRSTERKEELAKANEELKTQLRLLEAKASPSNVWAEAFALGFGKAWDMMLPLMREGVQKTYETVFTEAVEQTLTGLEGTIQKRLAEAGLTHLRPVNDLLAKREEFRSKAAVSMDAEAKAKYEHYVKAIEWALESTNGH